MVGQAYHGAQQIVPTASVLGISVHLVTMATAVQIIRAHLDAYKKCRVVTVNPEMIMWSRRDKDFCRAIRKADLLVPDGIGIVWALHCNGIKGQPRIAGVDLVEELLDLAHTRECGLKVYLLGGRPGIAAEAGRKISQKWPAVEVVGTEDGYFSVKDHNRIVAEINKRSPDLLLVGMGAPKQELWLAQHWESLDVRLGVGIGGGLDLWAGKSKRAPILFRDLGLEWLYRVISQPRRLYRLKVLPKFIWEVARTRLTSGRPWGSGK